MLEFQKLKLLCKFLFKKLFIQLINSIGGDLLEKLRATLENNETALKGIQDIETLLQYLKALNVHTKVSSTFKFCISTFFLISNTLP